MLQDGNFPKSGLVCCLRRFKAVEVGVSFILKGIYVYIIQRDFMTKTDVKIKRKNEQEVRKR